MIPKSEVPQLAPENLVVPLRSRNSEEVRSKILDASKSERDLRKLKHVILADASLNGTYGRKLESELNSLIKRIQLSNASVDFNKNSSKKPEVKKSKYFLVRHWKLTLAALIAAAGAYYYWPQIVGMAESVWKTRGLATAEEIQKLSGVFGAGEQASNLEGIGNFGTAAPGGLPAPTPDKILSSGFNTPDPTRTLIPNE